MISGDIKQLANIQKTISPKTVTLLAWKAIIVIMSSQAHYSPLGTTLLWQRESDPPSTVSSSDLSKIKRTKS